MIEHQCAYRHSTFSTNKGAIVCQACKLISHPLIPVKPVQEQRVVQPIHPIENPRYEKIHVPKQKSLCACGKEKTPVSKHCMSCASALKKKKPIGAFLLQTPREKSRYDWVADTRRKILFAEKNIERWKEMIAQYERMNAQKKEK